MILITVVAQMLAMAAASPVGNGSALPISDAVTANQLVVDEQIRSDKAFLLPARSLDCSLGRVANFNPDRDQPWSEFTYDGFHAFKLFLPSAPQRETPPPDPTAPAEPVDPRTKILYDPDGIAGDEARHPFNRVIDLWPSRVEMTSPVNEVVSNLIVIAQFDDQRSTAKIFMTHANDAITYDLKKLYFGECKVQIEG